VSLPPPGEGDGDGLVPFPPGGGEGEGEVSLVSGLGEGLRGSGPGEGEVLFDQSLLPGCCRTCLRSEGRSGGIHKHIVVISYCHVRLMMRHKAIAKGEGATVGLGIGFERGG
jgi:hypothetical protein